MNGWRLAEKTYINKRTVREKYVFDPTEALDPTIYMLAWKGARSGVLERIGNPSFATDDLDDTEKSKIIADNGDYLSTTATASSAGRSAEVAHRFQFDLTKFITLPNVLDKVEYGWDGYVEADSASLMRNSNIGWQTVTSSLPSSDGAGVEFSETLTRRVGVLTNKAFEFGVYAYSVYITGVVTATIHTDYVYVTVTYHVSDLLNAPIIRPKVIGVSGYER